MGAPAVYYAQLLTSSLGTQTMTLTIEAIYENGVFKPSQPLPLREQEKVRLQIDTMEDAAQRVRGHCGTYPLHQGRADRMGGRGCRTRLSRIGGAMTFADIPAAVTVFLDANTIVYHFSRHTRYGTACTSLLEQIARQELIGYTSSHVLSEAAPRLMTSGSYRPLWLAPCRHCATASQAPGRGPGPHPIPPSHR